ncbi:MAG: hypothetical protein JNM27_18610 [Leptospirales bacterium]|nr:hypothetical protein [Leptospirales bacterium]
MKQTIKIAGPFAREHLARFIQQLHATGIQARIKMRGEKAASFIEYSVGHDFKPGFREREHGFDARSIANRFRQTLEPVICQERILRETSYLRGVLANLETYRRALELRLAEIDVDRGSPILLERQRELREARSRLEGRASS